MMWKSVPSSEGGALNDDDDDADDDFAAKSGSRIVNGRVAVMTRVTSWHSSVRDRMTRVILKVVSVEK